MAAYWEIAAHPAYNMLSQYKYLIANLVVLNCRYTSRPPPPGWVPFPQALSEEIKTDKIKRSERNESPVVGLVFSHFGFWNWSFFLIAPFLDQCLPVLFSTIERAVAKRRSRLELARYKIV